MAVRNAPPHAGHMFESLRGLGYTTATALADLLDNSVTAKADKISIQLEWNGPESWVRIIDNGIGMDDASLEAGMRLGGRNPLAERSKNDLGRFGLGLKTASFSQARRLTVASRQSGSNVNCLRWDLDQIGNQSGADWPLFEGPASGSKPLIEPLEKMEHGTIVLWENLDRITTNGFTANEMIKLIDHIETHLAMTFHRLIEGPQPQFTLSLNGQIVKPWDPFLIGHAGKALESPSYRILHTTGVTAQCHVLPHRDMLKSNEIEAAAGPNGWTQQEGFYVYRNRRLLLAGGWLGLGDGGKSWPRDEAHRLARIQLDIPNSADADWKINVLKSTASPPVRLRPQLQRIAAQTRETARKVFAHRGYTVPVVGAHKCSSIDIWQARRTAHGTSYRINRDNDLVSSIIDQSGALKPSINSLIRLIEETLPVTNLAGYSRGQGNAPQWFCRSSENRSPRNYVINI